MSKLKIGVVGLQRGHKHALNALKAENVELTAVCDINRDKADMRSKNYGRNVKVYYDYRELLKDPDVDAVVMATPIDAHAETVIAALEAGKHVLSEVIVATTIDDIYRVGEAIKKSGKTYMMAENYCFIRPLMIAEQLIEQGKLGKIYYAESDYLT